MPYIEVIQKYAVFEGRAKRTEIWLFFLISVIISIVLGVLDSVIMGTNPGENSDTANLVRAGGACAELGGRMQAAARQREERVAPTHLANPARRLDHHDRSVRAAQRGMTTSTVPDPSSLRKIVGRMDVMTIEEIRAQVSAGNST